MEDNEFYQKLGTYDSKGVMVRRMVTEIVRYLETSLVSHGADSFARKLARMVKSLTQPLPKELGHPMKSIEMINRSNTSLLIINQI